MRVLKKSLAVAFALCAYVSFAGIIPLEREAWECVNPLGGDFTEFVGDGSL